MRAVSLAALFQLLSAAVAVAADVEDVLWDLQLVPLDARPAPGFALEDLKGRRLALADQRGRAVMLYFWLTS